MSDDTRNQFLTGVFNIGHKGYHNQTRGVTALNGYNKGYTMKRLLLRWIILVLSLLIAAALTNLMLPGQFVAQAGSFKDVLQLLLGVLVLSFVNATLGNLLKLLTLPLNCLTLGLFSLVINALMLLLVGNLGFGFHISGFFAALVGSVLLSAVNGVLGAFVPDKNDKE